MVNVVVYVEGGGTTSELRTRCRRGFSEFFQRAGLRGRMPRVVACGSRQDTYSDFCTALRSAAKSGKLPVLLVDSESRVKDDCTPWDHLRRSDNWSQPDGASVDHVFLMVQCMEAWFVADRSVLESFFGQGFNAKALPGQTSIEDISKGDVLKALYDATRHCRIKGKYDKARHAFDLLALTDPVRVTQSCPHAERLIRGLSALSEGQSM